MPLGIVAAAPALTRAACRSSAMIVSGSGSGLSRKRSGTLVYSPLFDRGVTVPTSGAA